MWVDKTRIYKSTFKPIKYNLKCTSKLKNDVIERYKSWFYLYKDKTFIFTLLIYIIKEHCFPYIHNILFFLFYHSVSWYKETHILGIMVQSFSLTSTCTHEFFFCQFSHLSVLVDTPTIQNHAFGREKKQKNVGDKSEK